jgi:hypothetical protein
VVDLTLIPAWRLIRAEKLGDPEARRSAVGHLLISTNKATVSAQQAANGSNTMIGRAPFQRGRWCVREPVASEAAHHHRHDLLFEVKNQHDDRPGARCDNRSSPTVDQPPIYGLQPVQRRLGFGDPTSDVANPS